MHTYTEETGNQYDCVESQSEKTQHNDGEIYMKMNSRKWIYDIALRMKLASGGKIKRKQSFSESLNVFTIIFIFQ